MSTDSIRELMSEFESAKLMDGGEECWSARTLAELLGYKDFDKFKDVIRKAKDSCINAGGDPDMHFREAAEIVMAGFSSKQKMDYRLTRWGAYLIAMNGNPSKERVAFAQVYFVARTQQAEVIEQRLVLHDRVVARRELAMSETDFSKAMMEVAKLTGLEVGLVRSRGDKALLGKTTDEMKIQYGMLDKKGKPSSAPLGDRLPTMVQRGKAFAAEMTKEKINRGLRAARPITKAHEEHNARVRQAMLDSDIVPESLPPEEDTKKLERLMLKEQKEAQKAIGSKRQLAMQPPSPAPPHLDTPHSLSGDTPLPFDE